MQTFGGLANPWLESQRESFGGIRPYIAKSSWEECSCCKKCWFMLLVHAGCKLRFVSHYTSTIREYVVCVWEFAIIELAAKIWNVSDCKLFIVFCAKSLVLFVCFCLAERGRNCLGFDCKIVAKHICNVRPQWMWFLAIRFLQRWVFDCKKNTNKKWKH